MSYGGPVQAVRSVHGVGGNGAAHPSKRTLGLGTRAFRFRGSSQQSGGVLGGTGGGLHQTHCPIADSSNANARASECQDLILPVTVPAPCGRHVANIPVCTDGRQSNQSGISRLDRVSKSSPMDDAMPSSAAPRGCAARRVSSAHYAGPAACFRGGEFRRTHAAQA